jgi:hypothetical protein
MTFHRLPLSLILAASLQQPAVPAGDSARVIDYRYATPYWYSPLGRPDDWHKQLADDRGSLLYDFGPGPYVTPRTVVRFGAAGTVLQRLDQRWDDPRVPLLRTALSGAEVRLDVTTASLWPDTAAPSLYDYGAYQRLDGISGAKGWAVPAKPCDPAFRSVAWGTNRPVHYRVRVPSGSRKQVVLGFCEGYKTRVNQRIALMTVEGASPQRADLAEPGKLHEPQVFRFDACDADNDSFIDVLVEAQPGADVNTILNGIWVYPGETPLTHERMIRGMLDPLPAFETRIDCGTEQDRHPGRIDMMWGDYRGEHFEPVLTVTTGRILRWDSSAAVLRDGMMRWLSVRPRPSTAERDSSGWTLTFAPATRRVVVEVRSGILDAESAPLEQTREAWLRTRIPPSDAISIPDTTLRALMIAALRPAWQARETVNGHLQFQPGMTVYRGMWADFTMYAVETACLLGDSAGARSALETLWLHRGADGLVTVMKPDRLYRETPLTLWLSCRYARRTGDWQFVNSRWREVMESMEACWALRESTLSDPASPNYGLMPAGFADGGRSGKTAEYSSVFWMLTGAAECARAARFLGQSADATRLQEMFDQLWTSYEVALSRDLRVDSLGNAYLPLTVGLRGPDPIPQLAQWGTLEFYIYADFLPRDDRLLRGTVNLHRAREIQGLPFNTGWLRGGVWAGYGFYYARALLLLGEAEKTADVVYAVANHAAPTGVWAEEQPPRGSTLRPAGDFPHTWHGIELWRTVAAMLAHDRGEELVLCDGMPQGWLGPGAQTRLNRIHSVYGEVSLDVTVSANGKSVTCKIATRRTPGNERARLYINTSSFLRAGFNAPRPPDAQGMIELPWEKELVLVFAS